MKKITSLSLKLINNVKLRRLVKGISARYLSILLEHTEAYVTNIESSGNENQYPPHEWPKLAEALKCKIHDLLPGGEHQSTGALIDKIVISIDDPADLKLISDGLVANGFFESAKSVGELMKHLYIEKEKTGNHLKNILDDMVTKEILVAQGEGYIKK